MTKDLEEDRLNHKFYRVAHPVIGILCALLASTINSSNILVGVITGAVLYNSIDEAWKHHIILKQNQKSEAIGSPEILDDFMIDKQDESPPVPLV